MLPQFPQFKKIELTDRVDVEAHTNLHEPYSDFNFTCLWAWDTKEERMISELNGNLVVKFTDYNTHTPFISFLGLYDRENTTRILIDYCKALDLSTTLRFMPDISIAGIDMTAFTLEESHRDFDYIFSTKKIALLIGKEFRRKRENANRFWRENPLAKLDSIDLKDHGVQKQIFETINAWEHHKNTMKKDYEIDHELEATKRLFQGDRLDLLLSVGLYSGNRMLGYAIGERLINGYAICHFFRGIVSHAGVTEALMQGYSRYLDSFQIEYMNFESDMDHPDIRSFKASWRPVQYLKRYNLHVRRLR